MDAALHDGEERKREREEPSSQQTSSQFTLVTYLRLHPTDEFSQ